MKGSVHFNPDVQTNLVPLEGGELSFGSTDTDNTKQESSETSSTTETFEDKESVEAFATDKRIKAYVDFSEYFANVEKRRRENTLPNNIDFS